MFDLPAGGPDAATFVARARADGVLVNAFGSRRIRIVTHLEVDRAICERAAAVLAEAAIH